MRSNGNKLGAKAGSINRHFKTPELKQQDWARNEIQAGEGRKRMG